MICYGAGGWLGVPKMIKTDRIKACWIGTWALALALMVCGGEAAQAQEEHLVLWDQSLARALDRMIVEPEGCNPYARSANSNAACADADAAFSQYRHLTDLDHIALFVDRYANARFNRQIAPGTRVDFRADVPDVLRQKADFKVQLKVKF